MDPSPRWGMFSWTWGEAIWVVAVALVLLLEVAGLKGWRIPFTDSRFIPLTWPVEANINKRAWFSAGLGVFFVWLQIHWWTDWFPWEGN